MKHKVIALSLHSGTITLDKGIEIKMDLPNGCEGLLFVFESKKAARAYAAKAHWRNDVRFIRVKLAEESPE